jgi:hypothetical protein
MMRKCLALIATLTTLVLSQTSTVKRERDPVFRKNGLHCHLSDDSDFRAVLAGLVGEDAAAELGPTALFSMIIENATGQAITTVVIRYPRRDLQNQSAVGTLTYHFDVSSESFPPGATLVLTPDEQLTAALQRRIEGRSPASGTLKATIAARRDALALGNFDQSRFSELTISLDSVTLSDGRVIGPDRKGIVLIEKAKRRIEVEALARLTDSALSDSDLMALLRNEEAEWRRNPALQQGTGLPTDEGIYQAALDRTLLRYLETGSRESAITAYRSIVQKRAQEPALRSVKE